MPKLGKADIIFVPVERDPLWHRLKKHQTFLGQSEGTFHTYHCRDWPNSTAPKTVGVAHKVIPDLPTPMGQTDMSELKRRLRDLRKLTGLAGFVAAVDKLTDGTPPLTVTYPENDFDALFNPSEINEIRFRTVYDTYLVRAVKKGKTTDLFTVAVPRGGYFMAFQRGFCLEVPPKPKRGVLYAKWATTDKSGDWFAALHESWSLEVRKTGIPAGPGEAAVRRRKGILDRMQRRGIPTLYR